MEKLLVLSDVLMRIDEWPWYEALFLPTQQEDWCKDSKCAVLDLDDCTEDAKPPIFAVENDLQYALGIQQVQDIVANVRQQRVECSLDDLMDAFLHYCKHDAFIIF